MQVTKNFQKLIESARFHQDNEANINACKGFHMENWSLNQPLQCSHQGQGSYLRLSLLVSIHACGFKSSPGNDPIPRAPARTNIKKSPLFIIGDWNAKLGSQEIPGVTGKFGLGVQNETGQRLTEFYQKNTLVIVNTFFQQHKRGLYTWNSPDSQYHNQIDYILPKREKLYIVSRN